MRGFTRIGVATLALAACRQTVVFDQTRIDGGGGSGGGGGPMCTGPSVEFSPETPALMVALDRSSGMSSKFGDSSQTQVGAARAALDEHAKRYQNAVRFGYIDFPGSVTCTMQGGYCCAGQLVPPGPTIQGFLGALNACNQNQACSFVGSLRPTPSALRSSSVVFNTSNGINGYMLLITNGRPDCESGPNSACTEAQTMIGQLAGPPLKVPTIVVAPGPLFSDDADCLAGMAVAGGAEREPYYRYAANPGELSATIEDIVHAIAMDACQLEVLSSPIQNGDNAAVYWRSTWIPRDRNGGWELTQQGREIVLHGEWCERLIQDGDADFTVFPVCNPPGF